MMKSSVMFTDRYEHFILLHSACYQIVIQSSQTFTTSLEENISFFTH